VSYDEMLRAALAHGLPLPQALQLLRASGASPVEAARAVQAATGAAAEHARRAVAQSRAWDGPRPSVHLPATPREWYGAIGAHGRSGHGASSVLPHLVRQSQSVAGARR
jgi:hypothetical protein